MMDGVITFLRPPVRAARLAASVAVIGIAAGISACGGSSSTTPPPSAPPAAAATNIPATTSPVTSSPAIVTPVNPQAEAPGGYQRIGGPGQGLSLDVPNTWVTVNFSQQTLEAGIKKLGLHGVSQGTLNQGLQALQKLHAVYAVDTRSIASSPGHFATNVNAYCTSSGVSASGAGGVSILRQSAVTELQQLGAQNLSQADIKIGGVPGVQTSYTLITSGAGALHAAQLEVLPAPERACFITLTATGSLPTAVLAQIALSVQYS
jgi:hypothetical protein